MSGSFITKQRFFDNKNYSRGFARHGDFTIREAEVLEKYGYAFFELDTEQRQPMTEEERSFVLVCKGLKPPTTQNEKIWMKYMKCIDKNRRFHTLSGGKPQIDSVEDFTDLDG